MLPRRFYLDSIFDDFAEDESKMNMKCDVYEKDGKYHIEADIPGMDKNDISVECNDGYLTIVAEKKQETEDKEKNYIKKERIYGKIKRQFYVGDVDQDAIEAEFNDGILKIMIPKQEKSKKIIDIK